MSLFIISLVKFAALLDFDEEPTQLYSKTNLETMKEEDEDFIEASYYICIDYVGDTIIYIMNGRIYMIRTTRWVHNLQLYEGQ